MTTTKTFAIFSAKKSGSSLLRQLLDGHPELLVYPTEFRSRFFWNTENFENLDDFKAQYLRNNNDTLKGNNRHQSVFESDLNYQEIADAFVNDTNHNSFQGMNVLKYRISLVKFLANLKRPEKILEIELKAINRSLDNKLNLNRTHCYKEVGDTASHLIDLISKKFIDRAVIIERDPRAILSSRIRFDKRTQNIRTSYMRKIRVLLSLVRLQHDYDEIKCSKVRDKILFLDYDKLVTEPQSTMMEVSRFLHIEMSPSLLIPSFFGVPKRVSTASNDKMNRIVTDSIKLWERDLNSVDVFLCKVILNNGKGNQSSTSARFFSWLVKTFM